MIYTKFDKKDKTFLLKAKELKKIYRNGLEDAFDDIGNILQKKMRREVLNGPKHGRTYLLRIKGRIRRHTASAPGQTPANVTGAYYRGIDYAKQGSNKLVFGVKNPVNYAIYLEEGTSKMLARPGLYNTIRDSQKIIDEYIYKRQLERLKR